MHKIQKRMSIMNSHYKNLGACPTFASPLLGKFHSPKEELEKKKKYKKQEESQPAGLFLPSEHLFSFDSCSLFVLNFLLLLVLLVCVRVLLELSSPSSLSVSQFFVTSPLAPDRFLGQKST